MALDKLNSIALRILFAVAIAILAFAVVERVLALFGAMTRGLPYTLGRLLEFSAIVLLFVIALLLRQIREELKKRRT